MRKIAELSVLLLLAPICFAQSQAGELDQQKRTAANEAEGLVPLDQPYTIPTAPHFAILVQFPKADSIRRIALGDSNYFLAEADKDDPHYAIVKQIQSSGEKGKPAIETNMLVYMASGRVINIMLQAGKLAETAYLLFLLRCWKKRTATADVKTLPTKCLLKSKTIRRSKGK